MTLSASSPTSNREDFRYPRLVPQKTRLLKCSLRLSALFVLGFCGMMLLIHYFVKDSNLGNSERFTGKDILKSGRFVSDGCRELCTTAPCIKTASHMLTRMDLTVDPCNDFHSFSCANYDKVSMGKVRREQFMSDVAEEIIPVIAGIIESIPKHLPEDIPGHSAAKARRFFDSCVSFRSTEQMAIPTFLEYLEYFGIQNWPHLENDYKFVSPDLNEMLFRLSSYDINVFFDYEFPKNHQNRIQTNTTESNGSVSPLNIKARPSITSLFELPFSDEEDVSVIINDILEDFQISDDQINKTLEDIFAFDDALYDIQKSSRKRIKRCTLNTSISCSAYQFDCSNEKDLEMEWWCRIAVKVLNATGIRERYPLFNVILKDKVYFKNLTTLLERTSHREIAHVFSVELFLRNMLMMGYRYRRMSSASGIIRELIEKFQEQRKFLCTSWTIIHLPALLGGAFYSKIYSGKLQKEADDIYSDIQKYLVDHIRNMTWMDRDAQQSLEDLIWQVRLSLSSYLPYISDASELDAYYERLQVKDENFLFNMLENRRFRHYSRLLYHDNGTLVYNRENAKFHFNPNYQGEVIVMDFSSFIYPLISIDRPRYTNLGYFGSFLAHEFSHGVEVFLRDRENMSSNFENSLRDKKQCLIDQYSQYEIDIIEKKVNGSFTLHENMADFFSLRPAYQALKNYQKVHGTQKGLPGLPFNEEQLFFISYAQWWCENNTPETMLRYTEDNHSPGKYRHEARRMKHKFRILDFVLLSCAIIIILACGLWILFHTSLKGDRRRSPYIYEVQYHHFLESKNDSGFKKSPPHSLAMMRTSVLTKKREVSRDQHLISEDGL